MQPFNHTCLPLVLAAVGDLAARLVFSGWLEEHGHSDQAD